MLDYVGIFQSLNKNKIKYSVAGGIAVNLHGIPRVTYDIDLVLYLEDKNLKKFLKLMKSWEFKPKIPVNIMDFAKREKREEWIKNKNMKAFNLFNPEWAISEIDILINTPVNYQKAYRHIKYINLHDVAIPVVSIRDLIKMKQKSNRKQDKEDILNLKKVLR